MAGGVNRVILVGNLGSEPELRTTNSGTPVCEFRVATNESWTGRDGQKQQRTEWHRVIVWGKLGEIYSKYLSKGRQVFLEGRIQTRSWDDKDGNKRYTTEIVANDVQFLGSGRATGDGPPAAGDDYFSGGPPPANAGGGFNGPSPDDDIPF